MKTEWDGNNRNKKDFENQAKQEFCALSAKGVTESSKEGSGDPIIDQNTGKQTINEKWKPSF